MSNLGVKEMLALLDALKGAVRDFAAREEKLNGEFPRPIRRRRQVVGRGRRQTDGETGRRG